MDIMILLDLPDQEIKKYQHQISAMTFDFNLDHDIDIKPIEKSEKYFLKWVDNYPFYTNVSEEGVTLYRAA